VFSEGLPQKIVEPIETITSEKPSNVYPRRNATIPATINPKLDNTSAFLVSD